MANLNDQPVEIKRMILNNISTSGVLKFRMVSKDWHEIVDDHQHHLLAWRQRPQAGCLTQTLDNTQIMLWPYSYPEGCNGRSCDCLRRVASFNFWCRDWTTHPPVAQEISTPRPPASLDPSESFELLAFDEVRNTMIYDDDSDAVCVQDLKTGHTLWRKHCSGSKNGYTQASYEDGVLVLAGWEDVETYKSSPSELERGQFQFVGRFDFGPRLVTAIRCIGGMLLVTTRDGVLFVSNMQSTEARPMATFQMHNMTWGRVYLDARDDVVLSSSGHGFVFADWRRRTHLGVLWPGQCERQYSQTSVGTSFGIPSQYACRRGTLMDTMMVGEFWQCDVGSCVFICTDYRAVLEDPTQFQAHCFLLPIGQDIHHLRVYGNKVFVARADVVEVISLDDQRQTSQAPGRIPILRYKRDAGNGPGVISFAPRKQWISDAEMKPEAVECRPCLTRKHNASPEHATSVPFLHEGNSRV